MKRAIAFIPLAFLACGPEQMISLGSDVPHAAPRRSPPIDAPGGTLEIVENGESVGFESGGATGVVDIVDLLVDARELAFGPVCVGRSDVRTARLRNFGPETRIENIRIEPRQDIFTFDVPVLPLVMSPGAAAMLQVTYSPDVLRAQGASLAITSDRGGTIAVALTGEGVSSFERVDSFLQRDTAKIDLLLVIDNSASMIEEQRALLGKLATLINWATTTSADWQIAVTTTDTDPGGEHGQFPGGILTPNTREFEATFAGNLALGTEGSNVEAGLEAARLALSEPLISGQNAAFLRQGASLAVLFVSDEDDQSPAEPAAYAAFLQGLKSGHTGINASAIIGPSPNGCEGLDTSATSGARYAELVQMLGGEVVSICDDNWSSAWAGLEGSWLSNHRTFSLADLPRTETIKVELSGVVVDAIGPRGEQRWSYDSQNNAITFNTGFEPEPGAEVNIRYVVDCGV